MIRSSKFLDEDFDELCLFINPFIWYNLFILLVMVVQLCCYGYQNPKGGEVLMYYSPLRYPGGKGKLAPFMKMIIEKTGHVGGTYIEPFAGGAGIAVDLLLNDVVSEIVINDYDKGKFFY